MSMSGVMGSIMGGGGSQARDLPDQSAPPETLGSVLPPPQQQQPTPQPIQAMPQPGPAPTPMGPMAAAQPELPGTGPQAPIRTFDPQTGQQDVQSKMMDDDSEIANLLASAGKKEEKPESVLDALNRQAGEKPKKPFWEGKNGGFDPGHIIKFYGAQMRANLFPDRKDKHLIVAQSMWGDKNAKMNEQGEVEYRPGKGEEWRDFNQPLTNPFSNTPMGNAAASVVNIGGAPAANLIAEQNDFEARHLLKSIGDLAGASAATVATAESGSPTVGAGAFSAAQNLTNAGVIKLTDLMSDKAISDPSAAIANKMLWEMGTSMVFTKALGGAAEVAGMLARTKAGQQATASVVNWINGSDAAKKVIGAVGDVAKKTGQVVGDLQNSKFDPSQKFVENASKSYYSQEVIDSGTKAVQAGSWLQNYVDTHFPNLAKKVSEVGNMIDDGASMAEVELGQNIGVIKQDIIQLAETNGKRVVPENSIKKTREVLEEFGVKFTSKADAANSLSAHLEGQIQDPSGKLLGEASQTFVGGSTRTIPGRRSSGGLTEEIADIDVTGVGRTVGRAAKDVKEKDIGGVGRLRDPDAMVRLLANQYDKLFKAKHGMTPGVDVESFIKDVERLQRLGNKDTSGIAAVDKWMKQVSGAATADRNQFVDDLVKEFSPKWAPDWVRPFTKYSGTIEQLINVKTALSSEGAMATVVNDLSGGSAAAKINGIINIRNVIGEHSELYKQFRGELANQTIMNFVDQSTGAVDLVAANRFFASSAAAPQLEVVFKQNELAILRQGLAEMRTMANGSTLNEGQKAVLGKLTQVATEVGGSKVKAAKFIMKLCGQNRGVMDFIKDDVLVNMAKRESDAAQRRLLMSIAGTMDDFMSQMKIVEVPTSAAPGLGKGMAPKNVERYMPYIP